jgi:uncharacterized damage-inducible protein DinB
MTDPTRAVAMATTGDERTVLESFLDFHRSIAVSKVLGVADDEARRRLVPSETTLAGLLRHLALVEDNWFQRVLTGSLPAREGEDTSWALEEGDTVEGLVAAYRAECARSRETAARYPLDHTGSHPHLGPVSLRWIYVHMIEETARHVGHADILREQTDGATGALG